MSDDNEWEADKTGPFCIHWSEIGNCEEVCVCGDSCNKHGAGREPCSEPECECVEFTPARD